MTFNYEEISTLDYFDSRDVVERLNEIKADETAGMIPELRIERMVLEELLENLTEHFPPSKWGDVRTDVSCGVQGFAEHYAIEYAQDYASDVTGVDSEQSWPFCHIDWEAAADDLKEGYKEVEILGSTFYLRD